jgi:hypothetical protein
MPQHGRLRIYGNGDVEIELVAAYLADLSHAYDSLLVFEALVTELNVISKISLSIRLDFVGGVRTRGVGCRICGNGSRPVKQSPRSSRCLNDSFSRQ